MGQAMERGLYMIEIIREESYDSEQEKRELPKNIRQIGSPDIGDRIYIENKVHEYMHPYMSILRSGYDFLSAKRKDRRCKNQRS